MHKEDASERSENPCICDKNLSLNLMTPGVNCTFIHSQHVAYFYHIEVHISSVCALC